MLEESKIRKRDIRKCYNKIVKQYKKYGKIPSISTLIEKTITTKAPSYYITYNYARRLLSLHRRNLLPRHYRNLRRQMIDEIAHKVDCLIQKRASLSETDALTMVLATGNASRFFISTSSARRLINH